MMVAHEDIRAVCATITGVLRRLAADWEQMAGDMNEDASKRLEAALTAAKLKATADAIHVVVDGSCSMAVRLATAEQKLAAVGEIVKNRAQIDARELGEVTINGLRHYADLVEELKGVL